MALKFSMVLTAVDRASAPLKRIRDTAQRMVGQSGLGGVGRAGGVAGRGLDRLRSSATRLSSSVRATAAGLVSGTRRLRVWGATAEYAASAAGRLARKMGSVAKSGIKWGGLAIAGGAAFGLKKVIEISSQFEQFQVILEKTEGSAAGAQKAMDWVKDFGAKTPYEIGEVMEAFVKLRAYGIDPTQGTLKSLGNASSAMGKDLMSAIEMIADAQTGEFERLKEFGIRASKAGDKVTFSYQNNGKTMTKVAKATGTEIEKALTGIFDERFGGMMDRQSKTMAGMWSNMKDQAANFFLSIGNAGFADTLKARLGSVLETVNAMAADGRLAAWAENISAKLSVMTEKAFDFIQNTDWKRVADGLMSIVNATVAVVEGLTKIIAKTSELGLITRAKLAGVREANPFSTRKGREDARAFRQAAERELGRPVTGAGERERDAGQVTATASNRRRAEETRRRAGLRPLARGAPPVRGRAGLLGPPSAARLQQLIKPQPVEVGGKVGINVKASPELTTRLERIESSNRNVPLQFGSSGYGRAAVRGLSLLGVG